MTFGDFVRECYIQSTPSVDLDALGENEKVNCSDHKLLTSKYEELLKEFAGDDHDKIVGCNMWMLQSGPTLMEG